jgi:hypothetical protein
LQKGLASSFACLFFWCYQWLHHHNQQNIRESKGTDIKEMCNEGSEELEAARHSLGLLLSLTAKFFMKFTSGTQRSRHHLFVCKSDTADRELRDKLDKEKVH